VLGDDMLRRPVPLMTDPQRDDLVVTFDGLISSTPFVAQMDRVLQVLQETIGLPVDIEFAHDGTNLVLLQCRTQSGGGDTAPAPIPRDVPRQDVVFTANRFVSNGYVPDLTHVVYVDPEQYSKLGSRQEMKAVGQAVGRLNALLPKRRFALLGPGRWGSRGDIKLGVPVTYSDINNTSLLIEIARKKGNYVPDLSFGTHFFQDLVEARIRYLPLYPDDDGVVLRDTFLTRSNNLLAEMVPEFAGLADVVHVIDIPAVADGRVLRVLLNAEFDEALGMLVEPTQRTEPKEPTVARTEQGQPGIFWRWRMQMAEQIAGEIDPIRFGVVAAYVFGSTKNATAGPKSDLDLLIHVRGTAAQLAELRTWLEGWSLALAKVNYLRTGYRIERLLDAHFVTDEDIAARTSWAVKIGAITDAARLLPLKQLPERRAGRSDGVQTTGGGDDVK
jgi:predicted nucleotidyltransferase